MRTVTPAHGRQQSELISASSEEISSALLSLVYLPSLPEWRGD